MKLYKTVLPITVATLILVGCSVQTNRVSSSNDRVIESNLNPDKFYTRPVKFKKPFTKKNKIKDKYVYYIGFKNDSTRLNKRLIKAYLNEIKWLIRAHGMKISLVGHSHGISTKGTRFVSTKRANNVYFYLVKKGISPKSIRRMASWSGVNEQGVMQKGVEIILQ